MTQRDRIVVGVDGSENSAHALAWAFEEAKLRKATLEPVMVWSYPAYVLPPDGMILTETVEAVQKREQVRFDEATKAVMVANDQDVKVVPSLREGSTARELLDHAKGATLLVIGSRGRGGFASLILGSVSSQCVHHAPCPVVVIPPPEKTDG